MGILPRAFAFFLLIVGHSLASFAGGEDDWKNKSDSLNHLSFEDKIKNPEGLLPLYLESARRCRLSGDVAGEMESCENASLLYYYLGKFDKEIEWALRAIQGFRQLGQTEKVARIYGELGYRMKHFDMKRANAYMRKGIGIAENRGAKKILSGLYDNYGVLKEMEKNYDSAYYFYNKGLIFKEALHDSSGLPYSLNNLGGLMALKKDYANAILFFERAGSIRKALGDSLGMCETYLARCEVEKENKQYKAALAHLDWVIQFSSARKLYRMLSEAYQKRALVYEATGAYLAAWKDEKLSRTFNDSINKREVLKRFSEFEVRYASKEKDVALLQERLQSQRFKTWVWISGLAAALAVMLALVFYLKQKNEKQRLAFQAMKDLEQERLRISRDLHDNIGAELSMITSSLDIKAEKSPEAKEKEEFKKMADMGREAFALLRETIWSIREQELLTEELFNKIVEYALRRLPDGIELVKEYHCTADEVVSSADALHMYRIAQESINNSVKYAGCTRITLRMENQCLFICDNGKGFDLQNTRQGYGLENMRYRAAALKLSFNIRSSDQGTCLELKRG